MCKNMKLPQVNIKNKRASFDYELLDNHQARRDRKLLLTKKELQKIQRLSKESGFSVIPTKIYISDKGLAKIIVAVAKGKKVYDKRESIKEREDKRQIDRAFKR